MTADSAIPSGSLTKVVTAAAVVGLAEDGDLDLDEPLVDQAPGMGALSADLTPRHLLSHTGGLPSDGPVARASTLRRYVTDTCGDLTPVAEPGVLFSYSNFGYLLAGALVEATTGLTWAEAVRAVVLEPLGIPVRSVIDSAVPVSGHAVNRVAGRVRPVEQSLSAVQAPAGALALSAAEWVTLGRALAGHEPETLLEPGSLKLMRATVPGAEPFGLADGWGLGLATFGSGDSACVGHDGNGDGTSVHLRMNPATGTVVALSANASTGFAMWRAFAAELPAMGVPIADYDALPELGQPVTPVADAVGDFANGDNVYTVRRSGRGLHLTVNSEPFADLTTYPDLRFSMRDCDTGETDQAGRFLTRADGGIGWVQLGGRLARRVDRVRAVA